MSAVSGAPVPALGRDLRRAVARALLLSAVSVAVFTLFTLLTTQVKGVRSGSPWQDDPYDAVVSFTELFVPGLAVLGAARALLCGPRDAWPVGRVDGLLRLAKAATVLIAVTVVTDLVALAVRADHALWNARTPVSVAALALVAAALCVSAAAVWRAHPAVRRRLGGDDRGDWLADLPVLAERLTGWMPLGRRRRTLALAQRLARWPTLPGHLPAVTGGAVLLLGGAVLAGQQAVQEGQSVAIFVFGTLLTAGSTYAGLAVVNDYLHLAAVPPPRTRTRRAARAAFVLGCLSLPLTGGFRDVLWGAAGLGPEVRTTAALCLVTFGGGAIVAAVAFLVLRARPGAVRAGGAA